MSNNQVRIYLICIGSELLKGETVNSNVAFLGRLLIEHGFILSGERSVPDDSFSIHVALKEALNISDVVITTGGLGPTFDDITRQVIAEHFSKPLIFSPQHYRRLIKRFSRLKKLSKSIQQAYKKQCYFPKEALIIPNKLGSAAGFIVKHFDKQVLCLPGVPREFQSMLKSGQIGRWTKQNQISGKNRLLTVQAAGITEVEFLKKLGKLPDQSKFLCGIYPDLGEVRFSVFAKNADSRTRLELTRFKKNIEKKLDPYIFSYDISERIESVLGQLLKNKRKTLSVAESCTGGIISKLLTNSPGSSKYFVGGITAYSNRVKDQLVGVSNSTLSRFGAVSGPVASSLASNIRTKMNTSYGIGVTGIAGPEGGSRTKPIGLVYISISNYKSIFTRKFIFKGDRERIRMLAAKSAIFLLWQKIKSGHF